MNLINIDKTNFYDYIFFRLDNLYPNKFYQRREKIILIDDENLFLDLSSFKIDISREMNNIKLMIITQDNEHFTKDRFFWEIFLPKVEILLKINSTNEIFL